MFALWMTNTCLRQTGAKIWHFNATQKLCYFYARILIFLYGVLVAAQVAAMGHLENPVCGRATNPRNISDVPAATAQDFEWVIILQALVVSHHLITLYQPHQSSGSWWLWQVIFCCSFLMPQELLLGSTGVNPSLNLHVPRKLGIHAWVNGFV